MNNLISLIIGIAGSLIATYTYICIKGIKDKKRYGLIDGFFTSSNAAEISHALVFYLSENKLEIAVTEPNNDVWKGYITLYDEHNGTIDWNYIYPEDKIQRFGLKKIVIMGKDNFKIIGEANEGYGVESFTRLPINNEPLIEEIKRRISRASE